MQPHRAWRDWSTRRTGFSLIELLIVIVIIAIVIAIVLPSLGAVRNIGRKTATTTLIDDVIKAAARFQTDERNLPGYFSASEMGAVSNATRGMSDMQNLLLSLAGGIVTDPTATGFVQVGPGSASTTWVKVKPELIGTETGGKLYFSPPAKYFVAQTGAGQRNGAPDHATLPDLIDAFGTPILLWRENEVALGAVSKTSDFASVDSSTNVSRFYWNANSAHLSATAVGKKTINQSTESIIGSGQTAMNRMASLMGVLGNPGSAIDPSLPFANVLPGQSRGKLIAHSAGIEGTYLGTSERGGKNAVGGVIRFGANIKDSSNNPHKDSGGKNIIRDVLSEFDDVVGVGGS